MTINHEKIGLDIVIYDTNILLRQIHRFMFVASAGEANPKWCLKWCQYTVLCEFYFGIVKVVKVVEQIHINKPKNQGFAKKCHRQSQMLI